MFQYSLFIQPNDNGFDSQRTKTLLQHHFNFINHILKSGRGEVVGLGGWGVSERYSERTGGGLVGELLNNGLLEVSKIFKMKSER